jgi:hypothetical protein
VRLPWLERWQWATVDDEHDERVEKERGSSCRTTPEGHVILAP